MQTSTINKNIKFTYNDYLIYPANGKQLQLINGDFFMTPAPTTYHQDIELNIVEFLREFVKKSNLGKIYVAPTDVVFSNEDVAQPDILFIAKKNLKIITKTNIKGAPDLIIEILSEKTKKMDLEIKRKLYAKYGVQEYWIVHPDKKEIEVLLLDVAGYKSMGIYKKSQTLISNIIKDLKFKVNEVFKK